MQHDLFKANMYIRINNKDFFFLKYCNERVIAVTFFSWIVHIIPLFRWVPICLLSLNGKWKNYMTLKSNYPPRSYHFLFRLFDEPLFIPSSFHLHSPPRNSVSLIALICLFTTAISVLIHVSEELLLSTSCLSVCQTVPKPQPGFNRSDFHKI